MISKLARVFILAFGLIAFSDQSPMSPWADLALQDLMRIHSLILDNHPGTTLESSHFSNWIKTGYSDAKLRARTVSTYGGYFYTLQAYVNGFKDPTLKLLPDLNKEKTQWPGFTIALEGNYYVVRIPEGNDSAKISFPLEGVHIDSCDGMTVRELIAKNILPFYGDAQHEADWQRAMSQLFINNGNPFISLNKCVFIHRELTKEISLNWRTIEKRELEARIQKVRGNYKVEVGVENFGKRSAWISLPNFSKPAASDSEIKFLNSLRTLSGKDVIVIDVRGNSGGDLERLKEIAGTLFKNTNYVDDFIKSEVKDWRASPENLEKQREVLELMKQEGSERSIGFLSFKGVVEGISEAIKKNEPFYRETTIVKGPVRAIPLPYKAKTFLLTDEACSAECLVFADLLLGSKSVTQVGLPTSADHPYKEFRTFSLPSGISSLSVPTQVIRNRARGYVPYIPKHRWNGKNDRKSLESWISQLVTN